MATVWVVECEDLDGESWLGIYDSQLKATAAVNEDLVAAWWDPEVGFLDPPESLDHRTVVWEGDMYCHVDYEWQPHAASYGISEREVR